MHFNRPIPILLFVSAAVARWNPVLFVGTELPVHESQTAAQEALGAQKGRPAGELELLQPTLDANLPEYVPMNDSLTVTGNFTFAASDVLAVLSKQWIKAFKKMYPKVTMNVPPPYAGSVGAIELIKGELDGVFVSRELKPDDISQFQAAFGYAPTSIPMSGGSYRQFGFLDAMAFIVNKNNPIDDLSFEQLDSILSTTRARGGQPIRTWGEVGVTGPLANESIKIYGLQPWNGFEEFVRQRILSAGGVRGRSGNRTAPDYDPLVSWDATIFNASIHVSHDPAGIAFTGLSYIDAPTKIIALTVPMENITAGSPLCSCQNSTYLLGSNSYLFANTSSPVALSYENVATAKWPLSRVTYFNTNTDPAKGMNPILLELQRFILSKQGQKILLKQAVFLPFRAPQQAASMEMLAGAAGARVNDGPPAPSSPFPF